MIKSLKPHFLPRRGLASDFCLCFTHHFSPEPLLHPTLDPWVSRSGLSSGGLRGGALAQPAEDPSGAERLDQGQVKAPGGGRGAAVVLVSLACRPLWENNLFVCLITIPWDLGRFFTMKEMKDVGFAAGSVMLWTLAIAFEFGWFCSFGCDKGNDRT